MLTDTELCALESWRTNTLFPREADAVWLWVIAMLLVQHGTVDAAEVAAIVGLVTPRERGC